MPSNNLEHSAAAAALAIDAQACKPKVRRSASVTRSPSRKKRGNGRLSRQNNNSENFKTFDNRLFRDAKPTISTCNDKENNTSKKSSTFREEDESKVVPTGRRRRSQSLSAGTRKQQSKFNLSQTPDRHKKSNKQQPCIVHSMSLEYHQRPQQQQQQQQQQQHDPPEKLRKGYSLDECHFPKMSADVTSCPSHKKKKALHVNNNNHNIIKCATNDCSTKQKKRESAIRLEKEEAPIVCKKLVASTSKTSSKSNSRSSIEAEVEEIFRKKALPKRTKSVEKRKKTSRGRAESTERLKKDPPLRRTRSYESITQNAISNPPSSTKKQNKRRGSVGSEEIWTVVNTSAPHVDERGLPITSLGCPPVATLRAVSPNNVETESFDALIARKLQEQEFAALSKAKRRNPGYPDDYCDDDRKMPARENHKHQPTRRRSKTPTRRRSLVEAGNSLVPLNPEEAQQGHRTLDLERAKEFVQHLKSVLGDTGVLTKTHQSTQGFFTSVLTEDELLDTVMTMLQTQCLFGQQHKPTRVDIGYHFCRGNNVKRIEQQAGFWSKIQRNSVGRSQNGDGIYTFSSPPLKMAGQCSDDVWLIVARLKGETGESGGQWGDVDAVYVGSEGRRPENEIVVLKGPMQLLPLVKYPCFLLDEASTATEINRHGSSLRQIHLVHESLQSIVDSTFNSDFSGRERKSSGKEETGRVQQQGNEKRMTAPVRLAYEIRQVVEEHATLAKAAIEFSYAIQRFTVELAVPMKELAVLVGNMLQTQTKFRKSNKPTFVEIGYHYCRGQNLKKMQQKPGFWTNIQSRGNNQSEDGEGIYTFNNPMSRSRTRGGGGFVDMRQSVSNFDDVWLLVARIQGHRVQAGTAVPPIDGSGRHWQDNADSMVVSGRQSDDVVLLRTSAQCFPILQFRAADVHPSSMQELQTIHQRLQAKLDGFFNQDFRGGIAAFSDIRLAVTGEEVLEYRAPETLDIMNSVCSPERQIYKILPNKKKANNDDCSICLDSLRFTTHHQVVRLRNCGHEFHQTCLHEALHHFELCPICNQSVAPKIPQSCLRGFSPSASMVVAPRSHILEGMWAPMGSLVISYFVPSGTQKSYHPNPNHVIASSKFQSYLPYNEEGLRLKVRLQYSFLFGLTFAIKRVDQGGINTGESVVWSSIPHKTRANAAGATAEAETHSFPDPTYFDRCNCELDRLGVPPFEECAQYVERERQNLKLGGVKCPTLKQKPAQSTWGLGEHTECRRVLKGLQEHQHGWMFCKTLPMLDGKIETPMDLSMVEEKLDRNKYCTVEDFRKDVLLTFDNAMAYHSKENPVHFMAKQLKQKFRRDFKELLH